MDCGFRVDLIVAGAVVVEIKAVDWKVGLLINFNECAFKFLRQFPCCVKAFAGASWDLKSKPLRLRASAVIGKPRRSRETPEPNKANRPELEHPVNCLPRPVNIGCGAYREKLPARNMQNSNA